MQSFSPLLLMAWQRQNDRKRTKFPSRDEAVSQNMLRPLRMRVLSTGAGSPTVINLKRSSLPASLEKVHLSLIR